MTYRKVTSVLALLCSSFILAVTFIPTRYLGTQGVGVFSEIFIRYLVPSLLLLCFFNKELKGISRRIRINAMLTGVFLWLALIFAIYGIRTIEYGSMGLLLVTLYVLIVPFLSAILDKKLPSPLLMICAFLCFGGLSLLIIGKPLGTPNIGTLLCFIASIFYALYLLFSSKILDTKLSAYALHFYQSITLVTLCIPGMLFIEEYSLIENIQRTQDMTRLLGSLAYIGIFVGFITYQCLFYGQQYLSPTLVVIILSTKNVFGALLDIIVFHVSMTPTQYLAYSVVIIATAIASVIPTGNK